MSAATCDVCGHALHGLNEMCGADDYGDTCECDGRWHFFCACDDRFGTVADLTEHGRLCPTIAENEDYLVEGGHLDPSARLTPAPNAGWRRSEPAVIQTADPFGPDWDQRKAEAAADMTWHDAITRIAGDPRRPRCPRHQPRPPLEAVMLVALWALSILAAIVLVGTDPETWRESDRVIDYAPEGQS